MTCTKNQEQEICRACGFCCDGTLFKRANSFKGEVLLPKMEAEIINGSYHFKQPCAYFDQHCTAYDQQRPRDCTTYKCHLLKYVKGKKTSLLTIMNNHAYLHHRGILRWGWVG